MTKETSDVTLNVLQAVIDDLEDLSSEYDEDSDIWVGINLCVDRIYDIIEELNDNLGVESDLDAVGDEYGGI
jgi:ribosome assembly protein YihI (activator of Der GTPase)